MVETIDEIFYEVESFSQEENELLKRERDQILEECMAEFLGDDIVAQNCKYKTFVSKSKGRSNGRNRKPTLFPRLRKSWKEVELLEYGGRCYELRDGRGKIDEIATELLGKTVGNQDAEKEFIKRLRGLPRQGRVLTKKSGWF